MTKEYDNTNRGSIWPNEKREKDTHPEFTGSLNVEGVEYWVSAWKRKPNAGPKAPSLSFSIKRKEEARGGRGGGPVKRDRDDGPAARREQEWPDDDLPF